MQHPFQCIATIQPDASSSGYLLAACGATLLSIDLSNGAIVHEWSSVPNTAVTSTVSENVQDEPPKKKQKTATEPSSTRNVIKLTVSPNQWYVVAVTDDKCVRVLAVDGTGRLDELSARYMPKRPCAVQVLPDNATIICGDKFGDVYSLPLLPTIASHQGVEHEVPVVSSNETIPAQNGAKPFKPSATNKTVHTQRNLKSLAAQQNQKDLTPKKDPLKFEHKLLLGHVSMLTDLTYATRDVDGKQQTYLITADRDEHIRVSRAPPQSHIVEGYCLGHKEFVSKVCVIPGTDLLVSGGGDDWIGVWDWPTFTLRHKIPLSWASKGLPIAVSGIWVVPTQRGSFLFVACEKIPTIFTLPVQDIMTANFQVKTRAIDNFEDPVLDMAYIGGSVLVSLDARQVGEQRLRTFQLETARQYDLPDLRLESANAFQKVKAEKEGLENMLYGIESLRKRAHYEETEDG